MGIDSYKMMLTGDCGSGWRRFCRGWSSAIGHALTLVRVCVAGLMVTALLVVFMVALAHAARRVLRSIAPFRHNNSVKPSHELIVDGILITLALAVTLGGFLSHHGGSSQA